MSEPLEPTGTERPAAPIDPTEALPLATTADGVSGPGAPGEMSIFEHLEELRWRIVKSVGALAVAAVGIFCFNKPLIQALERPLHPEFNVLGPGSGQVVKLIFTSPAEYFMAVIKVSLLGGIYLALPVILYQLLAFVSPGLLPNERRWAIPIVIAAFCFFTVGALFSYFLLLPTGLQFLVGFAPSDVEPLLTVGKYLGFAAGLLFATGLAFLLPLFLLGLSAAGLVTSYFLARYRRQAFLSAFVLAAIITPSIDIFTQVVLAGALYLLFELSIVFIRMTGK